MNFNRPNQEFISQGANHLEWLLPMTSSSFAEEPPIAISSVEGYGASKFPTSPQPTRIVSDIVAPAETQGGIYTESIGARRSFGSPLTDNPFSTTPMSQLAASRALHQLTSSECSSKLITSNEDENYQKRKRHSRTSSGSPGFRENQEHIIENILESLNTNSSNSTLVQCQDYFEPVHQGCDTAEEPGVLTKYGDNSVPAISSYEDAAASRHSEFANDLDIATAVDKATALAIAGIFNTSWSSPTISQLSHESSPREDRSMSHELAINENNSKASEGVLEDAASVSGADGGQSDTVDHNTTPVVEWDYKVWIGPSGEKHGTEGVPLPQGYRLHADTRFPWVCPIRSCRLLFPTLHGLSTHFHIMHKSLLLNDNEDGTLSVIEKGTGGMGFRAEVISKRPLDPKEPPMVEPSRRTYSVNTPLKDVSPALRQKDSVEPKSRASSIAPRKSLRIAASTRKVYAAPKPPRTRKLNRIRPSQGPQGQSNDKGALKNAPKSAAAFHSKDERKDDPAQFLKLETWEIAPGRIRDEQSNTTNIVAFSNAYLAQNQAIRISRDVSFQVITVKPGTVHTWSASANKFQLCSVASGKLDVKIQGQEFTIGANGMIQIRPGVDCTVINRLYIDAMVHVTVMPRDLWD
ncbi:hypothetical protein F5Y04DRAFT_291152 [Hypomontagnella monticulosa]|nr:hypothetical protein F5Y04DRAFT_291152 [Hypomontagnella monticulosa]